MAKVTNPLGGTDARGRLGKRMVFRRGGVVTRYHVPRNPNTPAQLSAREAFRNLVMSYLTQAQADLLYAAIEHLHDDLYSSFSHLHDENYVSKGSMAGRMFLPWGAYGAINPITASGQSPYATSIDRNMTLIKWAQMVYVATTNNGSNYWTIEIKRITDGSVVNSINTSSGVSANTATLLTDSTFSIASLTAAHVGLYIICSKTGSPGDLYLFGPSLEVEI